MKMMKIRASHAATTTASVLALSGIFAASPLLAGDAGPIPPARDRPWQNDDGNVVIGGRTFKTWQDYHTSDLFRDGRFEKCGTTLALGDPGGDAQGFLGGGPYDCSMSRTNPTDNYDPSVRTFQIPVVVHVIRNTSRSLGHISEGQVAAGIGVLNEDINALAGSNGEDGTDARIEFFLATEDPQGNPTNGITYSNNDTWYNDQGQYWTSLRWDTNRYLNIYTNTAGGNLGYAYYPHDSAGQSWDGVRIFWEVYGPDGPYGWPSNLGRVLTHEVGHYLGLLHVFEACGTTNCSISGDLICDTESQSTPTYGCTSANSCSSPDNIHNYMDYSFEFCMEEFTPNQTRRMRCAIEHYRPDLPIKDDGGPDEDGDGVPDAEDNCPDVENSDQADTDGDGTGDACDGCPSDPNKTDPGVCGCGNPDTDTDGDGIPDCPTCPGDFDGNGIVNGGDLGLMLVVWNSDNPAYDIDGNGVVNGGDLGYLLTYWGPCPE
jgi:hypothetical protein